MMSKILKFFVFCSIFTASFLLAETWSITLADQTPQATTYQLCITLDQPVRLDISSVCFESDDPNLVITSWRLINTARHATQHSTQKTITFQLTTTASTQETNHSIHAYFLELENKKPHHFSIQLNPTAALPEPPVLETPMPTPAHQEDFFITQQKIKRGIIKVLKAPFDIVQYITMLIFALINTIFNSWLLLFLIMMLLGFVLGIFPLFYPAIIANIALTNNESHKLMRLRSSAAFALGFFIAMLIQTMYFVHYNATMYNAELFTLFSLAGCIIFALILQGKIEIFNTMRIPRFASIPLGFLMGLITTNLLLKSTTIMAPWFINFLRYVQPYNALPFILAGTSLFIMTISWLLQPVIYTCSEPWRIELKHDASFSFFMLAIGLICSFVPLLTGGLLLVTALISSALVFAWKATENTAPGIKRLRSIISIICLIAAIIIAAKLLIILFC